MITRTPRGEGCCGWCHGTGRDRTMSPETNGMCLDCRGTGCAHGGPCGKDRRRAVVVGGVVGDRAWAKGPTSARMGGAQVRETAIQVALEVPPQLYPELRVTSLTAVMEELAVRTNHRDALKFEAARFKRWSQSLGGTDERD